MEQKRLIELAEHAERVAVIAEDRGYVETARRMREQSAEVWETISAL